MTMRFVFLLICTLSPSMIVLAQDGATLYRQHCASCHENSAQTRAPARTALPELTPERIVHALESISSPMSNLGLARTPAERRALAVYLSGKPFGTERPPDLERIGCKPGSKLSDPLTLRIGTAGVTVLPIPVFRAVRRPVSI